jgi:hypothetical protein
MTDRTKAERALAFLIHETRDEWDEQGVLSVLRKCSHKTLPEVICAALSCATLRHDQRTPTCIALEGEHWRAFGNLAGQTTTQPATVAPYFDRSPTPVEQHPATPEQIKAHRQAARATNESEQQ